MILLLSVPLSMFLASEAFLSDKESWYWNDEKFTVLLPFEQPRTYDFSEIIIFRNNRHKFLIATNNNRVYKLSAVVYGADDLCDKIRKARPELEGK